MKRCRLPELTAGCKSCGYPFTVRRRHHDYCSPECRLRGHALKQVAVLNDLIAWLEKEREGWEAIAAKRKK